MLFFLLTGCTQTIELMRSGEEFNEFSWYCDVLLNTSELSRPQRKIISAETTMRKDFYFIKPN